MPLPPPRVVTTGHTPDGKSIIASDTTTTPFFPFDPNGSCFNTFHSSNQVPASNNAEPPSGVTNTLPRCPPNGVIFCTTDIHPGGAGAPLHRTESLDYACVLNGEITMILDSGDQTVVKAGEVILQRGAMHSWKNEGTETCRMLFVMVAAEKIKTQDGKELGAFFPQTP